MSYRAAFRLCLLALIVAALVPAERAAAQGRIAATHGDWQIRCERPVGAPSEQCALIQNVEAADRPNVALTVIFLMTADRQARILRVLAPLGVLLPSGLGLSIDGNEIGLAGFVRCLPEGCIAEVELDDGLIERFEAGSTATFVIFQTPEEGIGIPISLNGFTAGFAALQDPPAPDETDEPAEPRLPVETSTRVVDADAGAAPPRSGFAIPPDDRTALDRLLEDDLFPVVAAAAGGLLLLLLGGILLVARGRRRRRRRAAATEEAEAYEEPHEDDLDEEEDEDDEDLVQPRRPGARRAPPRLAAPAQRRQLTYQPEDEPAPSGPRAPRSPASSSRPSRPRRPS